VRTLNTLKLPSGLNKTDPIVVGVSFGPDSMALLVRLLRANFLNIHVAHVHHGLRKESDEELIELKKFCETRKIRFHFVHLQPEVKRGNLEEILREKRFCFFKKIYFEVGAKALLLGQQANEQVETGLKRLFEGAHFTQLKGMEFEKNLWGMRVIRPQLQDWKEDILAFLDHHKIPYAIDSSNLSETFLRGRMRKKMLPALKSQFGKEIEKNIVYFMEKINDWGEHLEKRVESAYENRITGPYGDFFSTEDLEGLDPVELDYLFYKAQLKQRTTRKRILEHVSQKDFGKTVSDEQYEVHLEQEGVFIKKKGVAIEKSFFERVDNRGWVGFWKGENRCFPLQSRQRWLKLESLQPKIREKILKEFSRKKIPVFLRKNVYVLEDEGKVIYDFLSL
jgi:tRNA(Ile)-lysidine synthetase-like protein